jgi:hypothetical protein
VERAKPGRAESWPESFDALIEAGHRHADIMAYTWVQFTAYRAQAATRKARQQRDLLIITNAAMSGGEGATKLHKALSKQAEG